jgi:transcriptional regulator with XRE-family HTH domain
MMQGDRLGQAGRGGEPNARADARRRRSFTFSSIVLYSAPAVEIPTNLGGIVRSRREELGLTVRGAALRIGISASYLVALERGRSSPGGRPPVPSPPVLASIARVLGVELQTLLDAVGVSEPRSGHLLLIQRGRGYRSPLEPVRRVVGDRVEAWIEFVDPRGREKPAALGGQLVLRQRPRQGSMTSWETSRALRPVSEVLAEESTSLSGRRVGVIFGASSAVLRSVENPTALLESEESWEQDVRETFRETLGAEPVANVCVYRESDIEELAPQLDPLDTVLRLVEAHPHVAVEEPSGEVTMGPAAIESVLASARPVGVSSGTWRSLARAAAAGLARVSATREGG